MRKAFMLATLYLITLNISDASAAVLPKGLAADHHIKVVQYDPNNVVILKGRYGYQTQITFAPNEQVQSVSIGDSLAWQVVPVRNNLFLKPVAESKTNMTVLTNINSYNFQLDSSHQNAYPTYKLQFKYPQGGYDQAGNINTVNSFNPADLNWKYSFTGDRSLAPEAAFDNGQFTYFKFKNNGMHHLPAIFIVNKNQHETLINFHMQGDYLIVNSVAKQFSFRNGDEVTSIYNDLAIGDWQDVV